MEQEYDFIKDLLVYLPSTLEKAIQKISEKQRESLQEIRLKAGCAVTLTIGAATYFLTPNGAAASEAQAIHLTHFELEQLFKRLCQNSVYTYQNDIANGFITLKHGHRVGLGGTCVMDSFGNVTGMRNLSSLCIRFAKEVKGCADGILPAILKNGSIRGTFLVSPPKCGKTTMLRDIARQLSNRLWRVCIIDERSEIASLYQGIPQKDLGACCDVLDGFLKSTGMMYAIRNLAPQVILCDEIGSCEEIDGILHAMNAGIPVIATAHAQSPEELFKRPWFPKLLSSCSMEQLIFLDNGSSPGVVKKIYSIGELGDLGERSHCHEAFRNDPDCAVGDADGVFGKISNVQTFTSNGAVL